VLDRTRWIALGDVSRICHFSGETSNEDGLGVVSAPYATLFFVRRRHDVKNGTQGALKISESVSFEKEKKNSIFNYERVTEVHDTCISYNRLLFCGLWYSCVCFAGMLRKRRDQT
jgi:hypothetical protein